MYSDDSNNANSVQTMINDAWDELNATQNPSSSTDSPTPKRKNALSQDSKSDKFIVNSDGEVVPFEKSELKPIETWGAKNTTEKTLNDIFSPPSSDSDSDETFSRSETQSRPLKPISTYAKQAREEKENTTDNPTQTACNTTDEELGDEEHLPTGNEVIGEVCPECDSSITIEGSDQYCEECGFLLTDEKIDPGPEWRAFDQKQRNSRSRVGGPVKNNIHDKGLSTVIGNDNTDANGNPLSQKMKKKMGRLRKWDSRFKVKNTKERNLRQAFGEIQRIASEMDLPEFVEETACTIYRRALDEELLPGRSIEAMASASVYIAVRQAGIPKTLDTLVTYCRVDESRVTGAYSYVGRELGIEIEPPEVLEYLSRIASDLEVSTQTERKAEELLENSVNKKLHSGKDPSGMAAAAVYAATMITRCDRVTQESACEAGDVCELTIRTRHRELLDAYGIAHEDVSPPSKTEVNESKTETESSPVGSETVNTEATAN